MTLAPFFAASPIIQVHAVAAIVAFLIGGVVLFGRKGTPTHKALGRIWVVLMLMTAISSLFIWNMRIWGLFSPIHILSMATLLGLWRAVAQARARNIASHRLVMQLVFLIALPVAGAFAFLPGRLMHEIVFGTDGASPLELVVFFAVVAAVVGLGFVLMRKRLGWSLPRPGHRVRHRVGRAA